MALSITMPLLNTSARMGRILLALLLRGERVLRVTMMNPRTTERHIDDIFDALRSLA